MTVLTALSERRGLASLMSAFLFQISYIWKSGSGGAAEQRSQRRWAECVDIFPEVMPGGRIETSHVESGPPTSDVVTKPQFSAASAGQVTAPPLQVTLCPARRYGVLTTRPRNPWDHPAQKDISLPADPRALRKDPFLSSSNLGLLLLIHRSPPIPLPGCYSP